MKYKVCVTEVSTRFVNVVVEAKDENDAKTAAEELVCNWDGERWEEESENGDLDRDMEIVESNVDSELTPE